MNRRGRMARRRKKRKMMPICQRGYGRVVEEEGTREWRW
jgi:hypothetical protein